MGLRLSTNMSAVVGQRHLRQAKQLVDKSAERLASGYKFNKAADNPMGYSVSEKMRERMKGLMQAQLNISDGISLLQVAEGGALEIQNILIRLQELAIQSASSTYNTEQRGYLNNEFQSLRDEVDRIAKSTEFNGKFLLDGTGGQVNLQVNVGGHNLVGVDHIGFNLSELWMNSDRLNIEKADILSVKTAQNSIALLEKAITQTTQMRGLVGSIENRLGSTANIISSSLENLSLSSSRIKDTDFAKETAEYSQNSIMLEAGMSLMTQTNNIQRIALELLKS